MLATIHNKIVFECDGCGETLDTGTKDFDDAIKQMRLDGWTCFRSRDGSWEHLCQQCDQDGLA